MLSFMAMLQIHNYQIKSYLEEGVVLFTASAIETVPINTFLIKKKRLIIYFYSYREIKKKLTYFPGCESKIVGQNKHTTYIVGLINSLLHQMNFQSAE